MSHMIIIQRPGAVEFWQPGSARAAPDTRKASREATPARQGAAFYYYTLPEAAAHLRISYSKLRMMKRRGELPQPVKLGAKKFYTKEQLEGIRQNLMIQAGFTNF
jgi:hypothetical protein